MELLIHSQTSMANHFQTSMALLLKFENENVTAQFIIDVITYPGWDWTHWGQVTHICVSKLTIIGSDNGLSPGRRQAIIWTNAGILLMRPLGTNFSEILIEIYIYIFIQENCFWKCRLENGGHLSRPQCVELIHESKMGPRGHYKIRSISSNSF